MALSLVFRKGTLVSCPLLQGAFLLGQRQLPPVAPPAGLPGRRGTETGRSPGGCWRSPPGWEPEATLPRRPKLGVHPEVPRQGTLPPPPFSLADGAPDCELQALPVQLCPMVSFTLHASWCVHLEHIPMNTAHAPAVRSHCPSPPTWTTSDFC